MNKFLNLFNKFEISPIATVFIILTLLTNTYKLFFIFFLITFIHELGHVIAAMILKLKVKKIKLMAVGFNAEIEDLDYTNSLKEFIVVVAGPLTYFVTIFLLNYLYKIDFISYNAYTQALQVNKYDLFFNLLPLIPLDGGRIIKIIIDNFFTSKKSMIITIVLSNIFLILFMCYTINTPQWLLYVFLIITNISYILTINKKWKLFLLKRLFLNNKYKEKIHNYNDIYRNRNNYVIKDHYLLNEKQLIINIIRKS